MQRLAEKSARVVATTDVKGHAVRCKVSEWPKLLKGVSIGYTGEVGDKAQWLTLEQILPGLPPEGKSACVELLDLCDGDVRACVQDPSLVLGSLPDADARLPKARVLCADDEWLKIGRELVRRGLVRPLRREEVHHFRGEPLLNSAFGVIKQGKVMETGLSVLRFIMDLRPSNHLQSPIAGDINSLRPWEWRPFSSFHPFM